MALEDARKKIERIDKEIVRLLDERVNTCRDIGKIKADQKLAVLDPGQERKVMERALSEAVEAPSDGIRSVYKEIISMCRNVQRPTTTAFLGPEGSFSHEAARLAFGGSSRYLPCRRIRDVFAVVDTGNAELGIVPFENSLEGTVNETLDALIKYPLSVIGEVPLRIHQNLIVDPGLESFNQIQRLYSHPQALAQCDNFISENLSTAETVVTESTTRAVQQVMRDKEGAAIAGRVSAELYGLKILAHDIEDLPSNFTRFLVLRKDAPPGKGDKTAIVFSASNAPGSLASILAEFAKENINITMIFSRPTDIVLWEYFFFLDFEGDAGDEKCASALRAVKEKTKYLRILGSYSRLL